MDVDQERLRADIEDNAAFGAIDGEGRGRTVLTGTEANREAREFLVGRLEDAGLDVRVDAVGNVAGRWVPESVDPDAAPVAAGSHLDSVPEGGIFDGPLGVYAALEAVRAMQAGGLEPARPVEVVSFTEEESQRFGGMLGSAVAAGVEPVEEALAREDDGETLDEALSGIGFRGEGRLDATRWNAWLELHVEQATRLESAGIPVGIVSAITGIAHADVTIEGEANHAGTTPMGERRDALAAASEFVLAVERAANEMVERESETAVGTVGRASVAPNATNVVPGRVELGLDVRDVSGESMDALFERARDQLHEIGRERGVATEFEPVLDLRPTPMSERLQGTLRDAGERAGIGTMDLHSGAGHDAMHVASATDAGMLFAPSRDGISHSPREWTDWEDCAAATCVLAEALASLATE